GSRWLYRNVPYALVYDFLTNYQSVQEDFRNELLLNYLRKEHEAGGLQNWNVGIVGSKREKDTIDLGLGFPVHLVNRSRFKTIQPANIKALTTRADRIIDLDWNGDLSTLENNNITELRNSQHPGTGLLLIYPINKDSEPSGDSKVRKPLKAA